MHGAMLIMRAQSPAKPVQRREAGINGVPDTLYRVRRYRAA